MSTKNHRKDFESLRNWPNGPCNGTGPTDPATDGRLRLVNFTETGRPPYSAHPYQHRPNLVTARADGVSRRAPLLAFADHFLGAAGIFMDKQSMFAADYPVAANPASVIRRLEGGEPPAGDGRRHGPALDRVRQPPRVFGREGTRTAATTSTALLPGGAAAHS